VLLAAGVLLLLVVAGLQVWKLDRWRSRAPEAAAPEAQLGDEEMTVPGFSGAPAIAVLAFDNLSGDPEQEYFADGIAEDLITRLSSLRRFPVIARNSSFVYKGSAVDVKQVSRELGARYVVEGSVRRAQERVRISVQVIDASTGHHLWAETYDRELQDVFALQDEIAESIVASMYPKLSQSEWKRAARRDPQHLGAYDLAMRGWWHFIQLTADHNAKARSLFEQAIELDPSNGRSFRGLAFTHYNDIQYQWTTSPARSIAELERTARRGAALDSEVSMGQLALALAHQIAGRRSEMIAAVQRAIELNPSFTLAHAMLGLYLGQTGRPDEALPHLEKAMRLSPRDPTTWLFSYGVATSHFAARRYDDAVAWAQRSLQQKPDYLFAWGILAASQAQLGRTAEARTAFQEMLRQQPELSVAALRQFFSFADADWFERFIDGLRKAGLPEE
jgi:TolB-like protein/Tfp pilus assembly protein PilF